MCLLGFTWTLLTKNRSDAATLLINMINIVYSSVHLSIAAFTHTRKSCYSLAIFLMRRMGEQHILTLVSWKYPKKILPLTQGYYFFPKLQPQGPWGCNFGGRNVWMRLRMLVFSTSRYWACWWHFGLHLHVIEWHPKISLLPFIRWMVKKYLNVGTAFQSHDRDER